MYSLVFIEFHFTFSTQQINYDILRCKSPNHSENRKTELSEMENSFTAFCVVERKKSIWTVENIFYKQLNANPFEFNSAHRCNLFTPSDRSWTKSYASIDMPILISYVSQIFTSFYRQEIEFAINHISSKYRKKLTHTVDTMQPTFTSLILFTMPSINIANKNGNEILTCLTSGESLWIKLTDTFSSFPLVQVTDWVN